MICLDGCRSIGNFMSFMASVAFTLTTYTCCLMNPSDPLDNIESSLLSALRLLRTFSLTRYSFKVRITSHTLGTAVQTLKLNCETSSVSAFAGLHATGDAVA